MSKIRHATRRALGCAGAVVAGGLAAALASPATATDRVVMTEMYTATWCGPCQAVRDGIDLALDEFPESLTHIQYHGADAYTIPWGQQRMSQFYGAGGFPTYWSDGVIGAVGGGGNGQQWRNYFVGIMNQRLAVQPEVSIQMAAEPLGGNQWEVSCLVTLAPGEPMRTVRVYVVQVLDNYPVSNPKYRNTFRDFGGSDDVTLVPGVPHVFTTTFNLGATDASQIQDVEFIAFAQDPASSGPAEIRNAFSIAHPFPAADCDDNGVLDFTDIEGDASLDCDGDGYLDSCAIADGSAPDSDGDGVIDWCEDCNGNGTPDWQDILDGVEQDCNENGLPDACDLENGLGEDCNGNSVPDACEVTRIVEYASPNLGPLNVDTTLNWNLDLDGEADLDAPVVLDFTARGDLEAPTEFLNVYANGVYLGPIFQGAGSLCAPMNTTLEIDPVVWNDAIALADPPQLQVTPTGAVSQNDCAGSFVQIDLALQIQGSADADDDGVPDDCGKGGCVGDIDGNGDVGFPDLIEVISAWGSCDAPCDADLDQNGDVGFPDLVQLITAWGPC